MIVDGGGEVTPGAQYLSAGHGISHQSLTDTQQSNTSTPDRDNSRHHHANKNHKTDRNDHKETASGIKEQKGNDAKGDIRGGDGQHCKRSS